MLSAMGWRETVGTAPTVLKFGYGAFAIGLVIAIGGVVTQNGLWMVPLAVAATFLGTSLLLDIGGAARGLSQIMRKQRPLGVDYSQSFLASVGYARFSAFSCAWSVSACWPGRYWAVEFGSDPSDRLRPTRAL